MGDIDCEDKSSKLSQPVIVNNRYENPWPTWRWYTFGTFLKFIFSKRDRGIPSSKTELDEALPIIHLNVDAFTESPSGVRIAWIGHASVLFQFDGITVLTDPIFSQTIGPPFAKLLKRYRDSPCSVQELPHIDAVVISHNHYDHLDTDTVSLLNKRFGKDLRWFVPMGLAGWMRECGVELVSELTWWETGRVAGKDDIKFVCTPAQHWSRRGVMDTNKTLWCSWTIVGPNHRVFFNGDTGYCSTYKEIGEMYGPIDVAAIPIGAYQPRWMMEPQHVDPDQAVLIHRDIQAKKSVGIHWGTFPLSREFYLDPPVKFAEAAKKYNVNPEDCFVLKHGEVRDIAQQHQQPASSPT